MGGQWDIVVRGGRVVLETGVVEADIAVAGGRIASIAPRVDIGGAGRVINADGCLVFPGTVDVHVHLDEPRPDEWEGFRAGSRALAAGGCTTYFDMPLNSVPPTVTAQALMEKRSLGEAGSVVDFGLWAGLVPGGVDSVAELASAGAVGFKAFMCSPGSRGPGEFEAVDDRTLLLGMRAVAKTGRVLALHAESETITSALAEEARDAGRRDPLSYASSRPVEAEVEAVFRAVQYASVTRCPVHFVHVSSAPALDVIDRARAQGLSVSAETCPHYLAFTAEDFARIGAEAKCAPPLRMPEHRDRLVEALVAGRIDLIASDHSPCPDERKRGREDDAFSAWGGISGGQFTLPVMIDEMVVKRGVSPVRVAEWTAAAPARRFGLQPEKGSIRVGADADLAVVRVGPEREVAAEELRSLHPHSVYVGRALSASVEWTLCRGRVVHSPDIGRSLSGGGRWISGASR